MFGFGRKKDVPVADNADNANNPDAAADSTEPKPRPYLDSIKAGLRNKKDAEVNKLADWARKQEAGGFTGAQVEGTMKKYGGKVNEVTNSVSGKMKEAQEAREAGKLEFAAFAAVNGVKAAKFLNRVGKDALSEIGRLNAEAAAIPRDPMGIQSHLQIVAEANREAQRLTEEKAQDQDGLQQQEKLRAELNLFNRG